MLPAGEFVVHTTPPKRGRKRKNFDDTTPQSQTTTDLAKRRSTRVR